MKTTIYIYIFCFGYLMIIFLFIVVVLLIVVVVSSSLLNHNDQYCHHLQLNLPVKTCLSILGKKLFSFLAIYMILIIGPEDTGEVDAKFKDISRNKITYNIEELTIAALQFKQLLHNYTFFLKLNQGVGICCPLTKGGGPIQCTDRQTHRDLEAGSVKSCSLECILMYNLITVALFCQYFVL